MDAIVFPCLVLAVALAHDRRLKPGYLSLAKTVPNAVFNNQSVRIESSEQEFDLVVPVLNDLRFSLLCAR
jgi:hypothetical protein